MARGGSSCLPIGIIWVTRLLRRTSSTAVHSDLYRSDGNWSQALSLGVPIQASQVSAFVRTLHRLKAGRNPRAPAQPNMPNRADRIRIRAARIWLLPA
jgi:hypothetical protein